MAEEIRPARVYVPRRVRRLSREDREENEEQFRKRLAELSAEEETESRRGNRPPEATPPDEPQQSGPADRDDEDEALGRNLDLRT